MSFRTRQIRRRAPIKPFKQIKKASGLVYESLSKTTPKQRSYVWGAVLVIAGIFIVWKVMTGIYNFVTGFDAGDALMALGTELKKDENGYTNIVLLGDGGHMRDGADLVDTIMVASIDYAKNAVTLFSIPRDYYVPNVNWPGKINELYRNHKNQFDSEDELYGLFKTVAGDITNLDIQYYLRVNFNAFVGVVDSLDGVTVDVKEALYDPYYPNETDDGYTIFEMPKGPQEMDGETALKFVRSRKTTSDFDRAFRQQQVLAAVREKALSMDILSNTGKLKKIYNAVSANTNTDLTIREMIALAGFAKNFDRSHLISKVIHDDPGQDGGFLGTPPKDEYEGLFVLVPRDIGGLDMIHKYCNLIFNKREAFWNPVRIEVLSATKQPGIARNVALELNRFGFNVVTIDNYLDDEGEKKNLEKSVIFYYEWQEDKDGNVTAVQQPTLDALADFITAESMPGDPLDVRSGVGITIILGDDYRTAFSY